MRFTFLRKPNPRFSHHGHHRRSRYRIQFLISISRPHQILRHLLHPRQHHKHRILLLHRRTLSTVRSNVCQVQVHRHTPLPVCDRSHHLHRLYLEAKIHRTICSSMYPSSVHRSNLVRSFLHSLRPQGRHQSARLHLLRFLHRVGLKACFLYIYFLAMYSYPSNAFSP